MHYTNSEMKIDQLIGYFNEKKISLIPPFQRGHVWKLSQRQKLLENIVRGRPVPAIFLYKEPDGSKFTYNILDGKQRLESLLLFIGNERADMKVAAVKAYFFGEKEKRMANFAITYGGKRQRFKTLPDEIVRDFREYAVPTIEIDLDENGSLDEVINLFVDINQQGEKVKRFDIVKAIGAENPLLKSALKHVAIQQQRSEDVRYKKKSTAYTRVFQALQVIQSANDATQQVDRMWERLVEIILFCRTGKHRAPGQILKSFIKSRGDEEKKEMTLSETKKLNVVFNFLDRAYKETELGKTRFARDVIHFYTMITTLIASDLLVASGGAPNYEVVRAKLIAFARLIDDPKMATDSYIAARLKEYLQAAQTQTTHPGQRETRQTKILEILKHL